MKLHCKNDLFICTAYGNITSQTALELLELLLFFT
uniref:Uncharacterized protein n=1 Tax=Anguilla anguilla TaxID=7936 RepID=A0A0E9TSH5_ANGAN